MKNVTLCFIIQKIPGNVNEKSYLHQRETGNQSADIIAVNIHSTVPVAPQGCNGALEGSIDEFVISQRLFFRSKWDLRAYFPRVADFCICSAEKINIM